MATVGALGVAPVQAVPVLQAKREAPQGEWTDGVCNCCSDCGLCCCGLWCYPTLTGQIYERFARSGLFERLPGATCVSVAALIWLLLVAGDILYGIPSDDGVVMYIGGSLLFLGFLVTLTVVCTVRRAVRQRDDIPASCCGDAEDCCCAFWCQQCSICQLFRHEQIRCEDYQLCSPTGTASALV